MPTTSFMEAGALRALLRGWVLESFPGDSSLVKEAAVKRALELGDAAKYRLVDPAWVTSLLAGEPRADPRLWSEDQYDCEDLAFAARVAVAHKLLTQPPPDGYKLPPAFGFLVTKLHVLNFGVSPDERPYLYDVQTRRISKRTPMDGSFLDDSVGAGWLDSAERIRYAFI